MRRQLASFGVAGGVIAACLLAVCGACGPRATPVVPQPPPSSSSGPGPAAPAEPPGEQQGSSGTPAQFDYYVLAMSWSPQFCATRQSRSDDPQCGDGRRFGFIAHGLWPQYQKGFPQSCPTQLGFESGIVPRILQIMPSERLMRHEWERHGTCSGLSAPDYFTQLERIYRGIRIPERYVAPTEEVVTSLAEFKQAFMQANPGLAADMFAVLCAQGGYLREVRICFSRQEQLLRCSAMVRDQCRGEQLSVRPLRAAALQ
jgi:ribonuclease T2